MNKVRRHDLIALAVLVVVPFALFADVLFAGRSFFLGDFSAYNYPLRSVLRTIVLSGEFPYWNPYLGAGQPLAANAAYQVFYPPTWLILLPSYRLGLHLLMLLHLVLAATGTYVLLRSFRIHPAASVLAGLAFGTGPLLITNIVTSAILFSAAWIPWVAHFTLSFLRTRRPSAFLGAALCLAMQFLIGEPVTLLQTALLLGLWALTGTRRRKRTRSLVAVASIGVVALLLAAVQVLPLLDHLADTDRGRGIEFARVADRSTHPLRILELLMPHPLGDLAPGDRQRWSQLLYAGAAPFYRSIYPGMLFGVLCLSAVLARRRGSGFLLSAVGASFLVAMGSHTPLLQVLHSLGIASLIRYPEKFTLLAVCATIAFGAVGVHRLLRGDAVVRSRAIVVSAVLGLASALIALLSSTASFATAFLALFHQPPPIEAVRAVAANHGLRAAGLLLLLLLLPRLRFPMRALTIGAFVVADLITVAPQLAPRVPHSFYDVPVSARALPPERSTYRIFSLAEWSANSPPGLKYVVPGEPFWWIRNNQYLPLRPLTHGFQLALQTDYDLTALATTSDFVKVASTLANENRPGWVGTVTAMSNVHYIAVLRPAAVAFAEARNDVRRIQPVRFVGGKGQPRFYFSTRLVRLSQRSEFLDKLRAGGVRPDTAFVEGEAFVPQPARVLKAEQWNNTVRLDVMASGKAFLVMSVTAHKYWQISIDGVEVTPVRTNLTYQGVVVPAGRHLVEMRYRNPLLLPAGAISLATLLVLALWIKRARTPAGTMRAL
jgi:hypothetical protein